MAIEKLFFELLQVVIGNRKQLSCMPTKDEWRHLFEMSKKQALTAVAMAGVTRLKTVSDYGASLGMDGMINRPYSTSLMLLTSAKVIIKLNIQ